LPLSGWSEVPRSVCVAGLDGLKGAPYVETDPVAPQGVYGASKLAGEEAVLTACSRAIVLRTSWVYSATGRNFVRTMLTAGRRNSHLRVVSDQRSCPTSAADLARAVLDIVARVIEGGWRQDYAGVYHVAGTGAATWHELAVATFDAAARHGMAAPIVAPIATAEWPTRAQ
jgi:dTDP-4-dehydrorhamnose reductase